MLLGATLLLSGALVAARRLGRRFTAVEVAGTSMAPALAPGDYVLVRRGEAPRSLRVEPGLVVFMHGPEGRPMLKRVIGVPGEALRVGMRVEVNARPLHEPYASGAAATASYRGVQRLGDDEYFVLGDHRAASTDSRDFGPVHRADIEGVAVLRYWPPGRIGRVERGARAF